MVSIQSPPKFSLTEFLQQPQTKPAHEYVEVQKSQLDYANNTIALQRMNLRSG
jgi:hypothetical protein